MAGKQLEKVLKSIERQLLKLVITTYVRQLGAIAQRLEWCQSCIVKTIKRQKRNKKNCIRNNSKKPHALGRQTSERKACDRKKSIKKPSGQLHKHRNKGKKHDRNNIREFN